MDVFKFTRLVARAAVVAAMVLALGAGAVSAHTQTVDPNGNGDGFTKGISNPWAKAHCRAASPAVLDELDAANSFSPTGNFACPTVPDAGWPPGLQD
jgi:hypothetical protein